MPGIWIELRVSRPDNSVHCQVTDGTEPRRIDVSIPLPLPKGLHWADDIPPDDEQEPIPMPPEGD